MRVVQTLLICLLHSGKQQEFTMYPALNTLHSTLIVTLQNTFQTLPRPVCRQLSFSSSDDSDTSENISSTARTTLADTQVHLEEDKEEEEDFQMVPLDDEHCTTEEVPNRTLCIHEHALSHGLCLYPCPYANYLIPSYADSLDLSYISNFKDIMIMPNNKDIPALEDMPY